MQEKEFFMQKYYKQYYAGKDVIINDIAGNKFCGK